MSYNEIMGLIKPKTRLTNSAHHIELPVETPPDSPEPEDAPEEDSFDETLKILPNAKRESSMQDRPSIGVRQSNMKQSRMSLSKRAWTKNLHHD